MMKFQALLLLTSLALASGSVVQPVIFSDCNDTVFDSAVFPDMLYEAQQIFESAYPESVASEPGDETNDSRRLEAGDPKMRHGERRLGVCPKNCNRPRNINKCRRLNCYSSSGRRRLTEWSLSSLSQQLNQKADIIGQNYTCQIIIFVEENPVEVEDPDYGQVVV
jgi:hypothetical protein